jgi:hypothetical protein
VDVTLACSDGTTLDAHKVILSSVSTYFRDILKTAPCKHPIIILKDTCKEEASAMLEFAYTGEVGAVVLGSSASLPLHCTALHCT